MEQLFVETKSGNIPIDQNIVNKYTLKEGTYTPFTHERIVDRNGEFKRKVPKEPINLANHEDEIEDMENGFQVSTSEMLDITSGVDSIIPTNKS